MSRITSMQKTLIKYFLYEAIERLARLSLILDSVDTHGPGGLPSSIKGYFEGRIQASWQDVLDEKKSLNALFFEQNENQDTKAITSVIATADKVYLEIVTLSQQLHALIRPCPSMEMSVFLDQTLPLSLLGGVTDRSIVLQPEFQPGMAELTGSSYEDFVHDWDVPGVLLETVPMIHQQNLLFWTHLSKGYVNKLFDCHQADWAQVKSLKKKTLDSGTTQLIKDFISLRVLGPAYYFHTVFDALIRNDWAYLSEMAPLLFEGVNFFNFMDKTLVVVHEATEEASVLHSLSGVDASYPARVNPLKGAGNKQILESSQGASGLGKDRAFLSELLHAVESVIPERLTYSDKQFSVSLQLQERLSSDTMISASPVMPLTETFNRLSGKLSADGSLLDGPSEDPSTKFTPLYEAMQWVSETPHTNTEILNAAWAYKVNRTPVWLYDSLMGNATHPLEGLYRLSDRLDRSDKLLLKSVETAAIHRMLLADPNAALVSVH